MHHIRKKFGENEVNEIVSKLHKRNFVCFYTPHLEKLEMINEIVSKFFPKCLVTANQSGINIMNKL